MSRPGHIPTPRRGKKRREYRWLRSDGTPNFSDRIHRETSDMELIAKKPALQVSPTTPIIEAIKIMAENYRSLVVSSAGYLKGLLLATNVIDYLGGGELFKIVSERHGYNIYSALDREPVESIMIRDPIVAYIDEKLSSVLEKMVIHGIGLLPVIYRDNRVYGVVSEHDIVKYLYGVVEVGIKVSSVMSSPVVTIEVNKTLGEAMKRVISYGFRRLPVVENNTVVGILTVMDIVRFFEPRSLFKRISSDDIREALSVSVSEVMSREILTVSPDTDLSDAARMMLDRDVSSALVVDKDMKLIGIITERDILYALTTARQA
ncbi:MAG: CBS domain-containing protein [Thermoprotei archaeon]